MTLTKQQALDRIDELRNKECYLVEPDGRFWKRPHGGLTAERENAYVYKVDRAVEIVTPSTLIELIEPPAPPPATGTILLSRHRCLYDYEKLRLKQGYMVNGDGLYLDIDGSPKPTREECCRVTFSVARDKMFEYFELLDQEMADKLSKAKCRAEKVLGRQLLDLLKLAPGNPTARAKVMAVIGVMPAPELDTFDKIVDWVEATHEEKPTPAKWHASPPNLSIQVRFRDRESGRCYYSVDRMANAIHQLDLERIAELAEGVATLEGLADVIFSYSKDHAEEDLQPENLEYAGNFNYEDHESDYHTGIETTIPMGHNALYDQLVQILRTHLPDVARRLLSP